MFQQTRLDIFQLLGKSQTCIHSSTCYVGLRHEPTDADPRTGYAGSKIWADSGLEHWITNSGSVLG